MCQIYNTIGSLEEVKYVLKQNGISDFQSIRETLDYKNKYKFLKFKTLEDNKVILEREIESLEEEIPLLLSDLAILNENFQKNQTYQTIEFEKKLNNLSSNFVVLSRIKKFFLKKKLSILKNKQEEENNKILQEFESNINKKKKRFDYLKNNFNEALNQMSNKEIAILEKNKKTLEQLFPTILGAVGEKKVENELKKLSDDFYLINDFNLFFKKAIYFSSEDEYIESIQIDHLLVSPSGLFIIETKNWSIHSINNNNLYSPVKQIRRASFALFRVLSEFEYEIDFDKTHWGERKIPIRNLVVLINKKKEEEFQFVKILDLNNMVNYINYFAPVFSKKEIKSISSFLLSINNNEIYLFGKNAQYYKSIISPNHFLKSY